LNDQKATSLFFSNSKSLYDDSIKTLKIMTVHFQDIQSESLTVKPDASQGPENSTEIGDRIQRLENDICELVEFLWNLLPTSEREKAEAA
jgi:hypothetical protein